MYRRYEGTYGEDRKEHDDGYIYKDVVDEYDLAETETSECVNSWGVPNGGGSSSGGGGSGEDAFDCRVKY